MGFKIPGDGDVFATEEQALAGRLFGCESFEGVSFPSDVAGKLKKFYGLKPPPSAEEIATEQAFQDNAWRVEEEARVQANSGWGSEKAAACARFRARYGHDPSPLPKAKPDVAGVLRFLGAGGERNVWRHVFRDGARVMAVLAPFLEKGEDPVKLVLRALAEAGYDVPDMYYQDEE